MFANSVPNSHHVNKQDAFRAIEHGCRFGYTMGRKSMLFRSYGNCSADFSTSVTYGRNVTFIYPIGYTSRNFRNKSKETIRIPKHYWQSVKRSPVSHTSNQHNRNYHIATCHVSFNTLISWWTRGMFSVRFISITQHEYHFSRKEISPKCHPCPSFRF